MLFGWFNATSRGWRTPNSLVFRIDGEDGCFRVLFEYGTQTYKTGGGATFEGRYQTTRTPMIPADGTPHTWTLAYDPNGPDEAGRITFTLDGRDYHAEVSPEHKAEGAVFDRFGIMNVQLPGNAITVWFDDLVIDGRKEDFSDRPRWEAHGNRDTFRDCVVRPQHDFGFRPTRHAGGQPGEVGGIVWRIEENEPHNAFYYADRLGPLSLDHELKASGKVALLSASADSGILVGWFNHRSFIGTPPKDFIGLFIEGPSRVGHYIRPAYRTAGGARVRETGPVIHPDGRPHTWTFHYVPQANNGRGRITMTFDDRSIVMDLEEGVRRAAGSFDRFGFLSWQRGGHFVEIYFDDLAYTARGPGSDR